jgi:hypothetical protein
MGATAFGKSSRIHARYSSLISLCVNALLFVVCALNPMQLFSTFSAAHSFSRNDIDQRSVLDSGVRIASITQQADRAMSRYQTSIGSTARGRLLTGDMIAA